MEDILETTFSNGFSWAKIFVFWFKFEDFWVSTDSSNGLVPIKQQAFTCTNADQVSWCHMASLEHNEFLLNAFTLYEYIWNEKK